MLREIEIKISGKGFIPGEVQDVIAEMIRDHLIEQGILVDPEPEQKSLFDL